MLSECCCGVVDFCFDELCCFVDEVLGLEEDCCLVLVLCVCKTLLCAFFFRGLNAFAIDFDTE